MSLLKRTCKEVSLLVMQAQELQLPWRERLALRLHMMACDACPRIVDQLALMRRATERWRSYSENE
ncbi:zf-HC2 domain-containing protein [Paucibacter sediminis]|uniref:Zf-HC2 domain-containing protein n=1 Tax=Paucibacter sediminis TaxID=3019553 RepID=A0AA95NHI0_9BURK|nr:zf-HC2 domain-containing protein [Paucibacter sp. S2-9]WIT10996.1 zf-HC2 domain-containing protein [Paucibacter sp. S2-9]